MAGIIPLSLGGISFVFVAAVTGVKPFWHRIARSKGEEQKHEAPAPRWFGPAALATVIILMGIAPQWFALPLVGPAAAAAGSGETLHLMVFLEFLQDGWKKTDHGIWEMRGPRRHFTHSKVMAWVAFDRGIRSVEEFGYKGPLTLWRSIREEIHDEVCQRDSMPSWIPLFNTMAPNMWMRVFS
jgi:hypothetical protein